MSPVVSSRLFREPLSLMMRMESQPPKKRNVRRTYRKRRSRVPGHTVVPDTSILWLRDKEPAANPEFDKFWDKHHRKYDLVLAVPHVVRGELLFQQVTSGRKHLERTKASLMELNKVCVHEHALAISNDDIRRLITTKVDTWIKTKAASIIPIPSETNWAEICEQAIWRLPPFSYDAKNPDIEKGFRDALILESLCWFTNNNPGKVAFLCADQLLLESAKARLAEHKDKCVFFATLADFSSYLKLTHEKRAAEFANQLNRKAAEMFFCTGQQQSLWYSEKIGERLLKDFSTYFVPTDIEQPQAPGAWVAADAGKWWINPAEFIRSEADRYVWKNVVTFVQVFRFQSTLPDEGVLNKLATFFASYLRHVLTIRFNIEWQTILGPLTTFTQPTVRNIALEERKFQITTQELSRKYALHDTV